MRWLMLLALVCAAAVGASGAPPADGPTGDGAAAAHPQCDGLGGPARGLDDEGKDPGSCPRPREPRAAVAEGRGAALLEAPSDTDVTDYFLEIEVIPEYSGGTVSAVRVEGISTIDFQPTIDGLTTFTVDLHNSLTVNSVAGNVGGWSRIGNTIQVLLDRPYAAGEPIQILVGYEGVPQDAGYGSFRWWMRNGQLVIATLSEPFYARYWWPCKDVLDDKATMEMHVTVPSDMVALSNGVELGSEPLAGNRTKYLWRETYPMIPYLASLAIGSWGRYDLQYDYLDGGEPASMPVACYVYPDHWDDVAGEPQPAEKAGCDELLGMLETFEGIFGPYPWRTEKYGVVETGGAGGLSASMEHQTLSSMRRISNYIDIMAHELAHQWWGDEVTCQTWYDIWLNEGFASYAEALHREYKTGGSSGLYWARVNARRPNDPDARVYRSSIATTGDIFNTNDVYNKGAWVLHMLRRVTGDAFFFDALADYRASFQNDSATTDEFASSISGSFGADLGWFVDQWVMSPGSPDYEWNYRVESIGGQYYLQLVIWQTQDGRGYGAFTMPIDIRVTTASGASSHTVWNDDWTEYYVLPIAGLPLQVQFDADGGVEDRNWILWNTRSLVARAVAPPPVLVEADISVGPPPSGATTIELTFSQDIGSFESWDVALSGAGTGIQDPDSWGYDAGARRATLHYASLPMDDYVLEVFDQDVSANGLVLDGETDTSAWWDETVLPSGDGQPGGNSRLEFSVWWPACSDGIDNDADGWVDHPEDPGCAGAASDIENPRCQDGLNNDPLQDSLIDFDGGQSIWGECSGPPGGCPPQVSDPDGDGVADPDPQCTAGWRDREARPSRRCGLGHELAVALIALWWLHRSRTRRAR